MFTEWSGPLASGLHFKRLPQARAAEAQLLIGWSDHSETNASRFDGPGGKLAEASPEAILLDSSERWLLHGAGWEANRSRAEPGAPPAFYLAPTLLHEIGHALGLVHSSAPNDVMSPFYSPSRVALTPRDRARARAAYGVPPPPESTSVEYFSRRRTEIEDALADAVRSVVNERAERPLRRLAEELLRLDAQLS